MKFFIDCGGHCGCSVRKFRAEIDPNMEFHVITFEPNPQYDTCYKDFEKHTLIPYRELEKRGIEVHHWIKSWNYCQ